VGLQKEGHCETRARLQLVVQFRREQGYFVHTTATATGSWENWEREAVRKAEIRTAEEEGAAYHPIRGKEEPLTVSILPQGEGLVSSSAATHSAEIFGGGTKAQTHEERGRPSL